jgi:hypothetical protein
MGDLFAAQFVCVGFHSSLVRARYHEEMPGNDRILLLGKPLLIRMPVEEFIFPLPVFRICLSFLLCCGLLYEEILFPLVVLPVFRPAREMIHETHEKHKKRKKICVICVICGPFFYLAWNRGFSPLGIFSKKADNAFVETLRNRFTYKKKPKS